MRTAIWSVSLSMSRLDPAPTRRSFCSLMRASPPSTCVRSCFVDTFCPQKLPQMLLLVAGGLKCFLSKPLPGIMEPFERCMMQADPSVVRDMLRHCMVARIATLSRAGRPSVTPLYFVVLDDHIWLGTVDWTLAARNVRSDQRASILFAVEQEPASHHVLRITG